MRNTIANEEIVAELHVALRRALVEEEESEDVRFGGDGVQVSGVAKGLAEDPGNLDGGVAEIREVPVVGSYGSYGSLRFF